MKLFSRDFYVSPERLGADLRALGVQRGDVLLCHASLSEIGWVPGGEITLLGVLLDLLGPTGTLVVPTFTTYLSDPGSWRNNPVGPEAADEIRRALPEFDRHLHEPQRGLGVLPRVVVRHRASHRSEHPIYSFGAIGDRAEALTQGVGIDFALGCTGLLGRLIDVEPKVLCVGLPWWKKFTLFHLAECIAPFPGRRVERAALKVAGQWRNSTQLVLHDGDFHRLRMPSAVLAHGRVGSADSWVIDGESAVAGAISNLLASRRFGQINWDLYHATTWEAPPHPL